MTPMPFLRGAHFTIRAISDFQAKFDTNVKIDPKITYSDKKPKTYATAEKIKKLQKINKK